MSRNKSCCFLFVYGFYFGGRNRDAKNEGGNVNVIEKIFSN